MSILEAKRRRGLELLQEISREKNIDIPSIVGPYIFHHLVEVRREFCKRASELGLGSVTIGRILKRNHSTIRYHLDPEMREAKRERNRRRRNGIG